VEFKLLIAESIFLEGDEEKVDLNKNFSICYKLQASPFLIWSFGEKQLTSLTVFQAPTGLGKSVFIKKVFLKLLKDREDIAFCYIPQNPAIPKHWTVAQLAPSNSLWQDFFLKFGASTGNVLARRFLSEFSGGSIKRILVGSSLANLLERNNKLNVLILDETLDSTGFLTWDFVKVCFDYWTAMQSFNNQTNLIKLSFFVVTHLQVPPGIRVISLVKASASVDQVLRVIITNSSL